MKPSPPMTTCWMIDVGPTMRTNFTVSSTLSAKAATATATMTRGQPDAADRLERPDGAHDEYREDEERHAKARGAAEREAKVDGLIVRTCPREADRRAERRAQQREYDVHHDVETSLAVDDVTCVLHLVGRGQPYEHSHAEHPFLRVRLG